MDDLAYLEALPTIMGGGLASIWFIAALPNAIVCGMIAESKGRSGSMGFLGGLLFFPWSTLYYLGVAPLPSKASHSLRPWTDATPDTLRTPHQ